MGSDASRSKYRGEIWGTSLKDDNWGPKRTFGYLNSWCPSLVGVLVSKHDITLITNGGETKSAAWYIMSYATKGQKKTYNSSALLAKTVIRHDESDAYQGDVRERNWLLLFRCWNTLNRMSELSAHQVVMYLMGWGDSFKSHQYVALYWSSVHRYLCRQHPELRER
ncbi:hypothetical protein AURDEDRAFT_66830 [Auricularia subglabra TFB-10046 SS5]|nr:hypothetical protein AURDEDRAFT_66830 [Auricularia subglabra TFB-10046 SS5]